MFGMKEIHAIIDETWKCDIRQDFEDKKIRNERDLVASLYCHLRHKLEGDTSLKLTLEFPLHRSSPSKSESRRLDLVIRRIHDPKDWGLLVAFECKIRPKNLGNDIENLLEAEDSSASGSARRGYLCFVIKEDDKPDIHIQEGDRDGFLWMARGIRTTLDPKKRDAKWEREWDDGWQLLPLASDTYRGRADSE